MTLSAKPNAAHFAIVISFIVGILIIKFDCKNPNCRKAVLSPIIGVFESAFSKK